MHPPPFMRPDYIPPQPQFRTHVPGLRLFKPMQCSNHTTIYHPQRWSDYQSRSEEHWCETCDRGFGTLQLLEYHKQQHQKCNIDGCQFIAHPKVITKHIQMQHSTGLYSKIAKLDNPEEIKKWREERRKRYPTKENIEKKGAEIKEKLDRGEKLGLKFRRENKFNQTGQGMKRKYRHENNKKQNFKRRLQTSKNAAKVNKSEILHEVNKMPQKPKRNTIIIPPTHLDEPKKLKPFAGILSLLNDTDDIHNNSDNITDIAQNNYLIEDDYYTVDESREIHANTDEPIVCGALSSLICSYESSDDEPVMPNNEIIESKHDNSNTLSIPNGVAAQNTVIKTDECENFTNISNNLGMNDDDSGPEETKIVKVIEDSNISSLKEEKNHIKAIKKYDMDNVMNNTIKLKRKLPSTLLEKLLHSEIRHERNIVLQCIRYIVKHNYFDKNA